MNRRIIVLTTDGGSREDGNVYYAQYLIVEHPTLEFKEPIFNSLSTKYVKSGDDFIVKAREYGYTVYDDDWIIVEVPYADDEDEFEDDEIETGEPGFGQKPQEINALTGADFMKMVSEKLGDNVPGAQDFLSKFGSVKRLG